MQVWSKMPNDFMFTQFCNTSLLTSCLKERGLGSAEHQQPLNHTLQLFGTVH